MPAGLETRPRQTKGERTAARILDAAETIFAERGFEAASLREIARAAGIQQPGLYNHFGSKQLLYAAVLDRALTPMLAAMQEHARLADPGAVPAQLPAVMTDILLEHPKLAALFQQALQGDTRSAGTRLVQRWLDRLFGQALESMDAMGFRDIDRSELAIQVIAMFNVTTGYFLSQRAFASMTKGDIHAPENIERQKRLLERIARATLTG